MAGNIFQAKRTSVAGRTPNTTNSSNSQYIRAGELALNMTDQILYTSDGSNLVVVGANLVNQNITGNLTVSNVLVNTVTVNTSISVGSNVTINTSAIAIDNVFTANSTEVYSNGNIVAAGNVSAVYFIGDGSKLTGLIPAFQTYVFANSSAGISGYYRAEIGGSFTAGLQGSISNTVSTSNTYLGGFITDSGYPNETQIPAGTFVCYFETTKSSGSQNYYTYYQIYSRTVGGVETLIANSDLSTIQSVNTVVQQQVQALLASPFTLNTTDRLVFKFYAAVTGGGTTPTISVNFDDGDQSYIITPAQVADVSRFVPYSQATGNVDLNGYTINAGALSVGTNFVANTSEVKISVPLQANGSNGTAGQVLTSNGSTGSPYWSTVSSNGGSLPGGTNTTVQYNDSGSLGGSAAFTFDKTTNTLSIDATSKIFLGNSSVSSTVNSTVFTGTANNASYLGGTAAAGYQTTAGLSANVATLTANNSTYAFGKTEGNLNVNSALVANNSTYAFGKTESNLNVNSAVYANSTTYINANTGIVSNATGVYVNATYIGTLTANNATYAFGKTEGALNVNSALVANNSTYAFGKTEGNLNVNNALTSNNSSYLGGTAAASYQLNSTLAANVATLTANNSTYAFGKTEGALNVNSALTANNSTNLGGQPGSYYTNATNITTGTLPWTQAPSGTVNTSGNFTFTGSETFNSNVNIAGNLTSIFSVGNTTGNVQIYFDPSNSSIATFYSNVNNYIEVNITNANTGKQVSSDLVLYDSTGITSNDYIDIGINGTTFTDPTWTINGPSDGYLYMGNNNLSIGTATAAYLSFFTGGTLAANERMRITGGGNVGINNTAPAHTFSVNGVTFLGGNVTIGNSTVNASLNSTAYSGTANVANYIVANTGIISNSSGVFVNSAYINTISSNLAYYIIANTGLVSNATGVYVNASYINTISANLAYYVVANSGIVSNSSGVFVNANTGLVANATGVYVNTTYIGTLSANNATYLNGQLASYYTNASNITTGTLPWTQAPSGTVNTSGNFTLSGNTTLAGTNTVISSNLTLSGASISGTSTDLTIRNATVQGNLAVLGTVTSINTVSLVVNDNIIELGDNNNTTDAVDTGWFSPAGNSTSTWYSGIVRQAAKSTNNNPYFWLFGTNTNPNTSATVDTSANTVTGTLQAYLLPYGSGGALVVNSSAVVLTANATVVVNVTANNISGNGSGITSVNAVALGGKTESTLNVNSALTANLATYIVANTGLVSNATGVYVNAAYINTISANLAYYIIANSGLVSNSLGVFVNTTYIGTLSANNATYLNGQPASYYTNATNITTGTLPWSQAPSGTVNTSGSFTFTGIETFNGNVVFGNATVNATAFANTTNVYFTGIAYTANNATNLGGTAAASYQLNSTLAANVATLTANLATYIVANTGLVSNATGVYVNAAYINTISSNLAYYVIANTGIVSNATGVYVNAAYINTISANNASYLGGYTFAAPSTIGTTTANSAVFTTANVTTFNTGSGSGSATGGITVNASVITIGNSTVNVTTNSTHFYAGNSTYYGFGNSTTDALVNPTGNNILTPTTITISNATATVWTVNTTGEYHTGTINASSFTTGSGGGSATGGISTNSTAIVIGNSTVNTTTNATSFTGTASNATNLNSQPGSYYTNATNITTGTLPWAQAPTNTVNTTSAFTFTAVETFTSNLVVNAAIIAGGNSGTAGQVLTSNGAGNVYWSTSSAGFTNGASISVNNFVITGAFSANSSNGAAGQALYSNGTGTYWANGITRVYSTTTASASQNVFSTTSPFVGVDVYYNGVHLSNTDYLVVNTTSIQLVANATSGDIIELVGYTGVTLTVGALSAAGANTQVQFNDSGSANGVTSFTFDKTSNTLYTGNTSSQYSSINAISTVSSMGFQNQQTLNFGTYTTNASLNMVIVGPYTVATGNSLVITPGSRVVVI